jgi:hypothetical protein
MKFAITYDIAGPGGRLNDIPNKPPVIECDSLRLVLEKLSEGLPQPFGCECVKVVVEKVEDI